MLSVFYGSLFYHLKTGTAVASYTNRMALLFYCLMFIMFGHMQSIPVLFKERLIFYRERGAKAYGALPYWFASWYFYIPTIFFNVLIFSSIVYNMVGLNPAPGHFWFFFVVLFLCSITGLFMCQLVASISPTAPSAITILPIAYFFAIALSGFIVYISQLTVALRVWAPYVSYMRWGYQALILNEMQGNANLPNGQDYINNLSFNTFSKHHCLGMVGVFTAFFSISLLLVLRFVNFEKR